MSSKNIYILDDTDSNIEIFDTYLLSDGIDRTVFKSVDEVLSNRDADDHLILLINYLTLLKASREEVIRLFHKLKNDYLIVYQVPSNANRRLAFYDLGSWRVFDEQYSLEEIYYSQRWFFKNLMQETISEPIYSKGRLEDINLKALIRLLGKRGDSGVLKLTNRYNSGKIYFRQGFIDDAQVGPHRGLTAVLHMLLWTRGTFTFTITRQHLNQNQVHLSNPGILLIGKQVADRFEQYLSMLGDIRSVLRIKNAGDLKQANLDIREDFIDYLTRPHPVGEILDNPYYPDYLTVEKLSLLKDKDFLYISEPIDNIIRQKKEESFYQNILPSIQLNFSKKETKQLREQLNLDQEKSAKIFLLSPDEKSEVQLIMSLSPREANLPSASDIEVAEIQADDKLTMYLIGMKMSQVAIETIENMSKSITAFIFLIDSRQTALFEYSNYVINQLLKLKEVPSVVAVTHTENDQELAQVEDQFYPVRTLKWLRFKPGSEEQIRNLLLNIELIEEPEPEEAEQEEEQ